jgi:hypothetical protein
MNSRKLSGYILGISIIVMGIASYFMDFLKYPAKEMLLVLFTIYGVWRIYRAFNMDNME